MERRGSWVRGEGEVERDGEGVREEERGSWVRREEERNGENKELGKGRGRARVG